MPSGMWTIGNFSEYRFDGTFTFCKGEGLVLYSRTIDFDADYMPAFHSFLEKNGQPKRTSNLQIPMYGNGSLVVPTVEIAWYKGNDRITLSFSPELRDGKGQLRLSRNAYINYATKSSCSKDF